MSTNPTARPRTVDAPAGHWDLEPADSTVEFTGRHFFLLPVRCSLPVRSGRAELAADGTLAGLDAAVGVAGFESGDPQRDAAVRGPRFLDAERFPELRFTGERLVPGAGVPGPAVTGLLEVKGRRRPVTFTVDELAVDGERATVRATARVDRHACGVGALRGLVGAGLLVRVRAVFVRRS
ncbi:YceI family protein [Streptomyces caelestis]|uniref:YceI family protein n=1 Tax=Streptomyces caelestis TaxID=36816 RepID=UPI00365C04C2